MPTFAFHNRSSHSQFTFAVHIRAKLVPRPADVHASVSGCGSWVSKQRLDRDVRAYRGKRLTEAGGVVAPGLEPPHITTCSADEVPPVPLRGGSGGGVEDYDCKDADRSAGATSNQQRSTITSIIARNDCYDKRDTIAETRCCRHDCCRHENYARLAAVRPQAIVRNGLPHRHQFCAIR